MKLCLIGAATDTSNLGVSALCYSTVPEVARRIPDAEITVFDNGRGIRPATLPAEPRDVVYRLCGAYNTRRYYRRESYWNMRVSGWFGGAGNFAAKAFLESKAILDISGGDSFCDMYGPKVFRSNTMMKRMALAHRVPLVLLPQTYGPFNDPRHRAIAEDIVRKASLAWARDRRSFEKLRELLGNAFDPARHMCGVDVAFRLPIRRPATPPDWLSAPGEQADRPIGLNISGLIYNDPTAAREKYGLKADYRELVHQLLMMMLRRTDNRIIVIPHVHAKPPSVESDSAANDAVIAQIPEKYRSRIFVLPPYHGPSETKWIISQTEWFCGTRMHATIGALSSGTPCAAIAYSIKTAGVFETCGQGDHVVDPREQTTEEVLERLWWSWENRDRARRELGQALPDVFAKGNAQMDTLATALRSF